MLAAILKAALAPLLGSLAATAEPASSQALPVADKAQVAPPTTIPEYAPVRAVLISDQLFAAGYHAPELMAAIVAAGAEPWIVTADEQPEAALKKALTIAGVKAKTLGKAAFIHIPHADIWLRDFGPFFARDSAAPGGLAVLDLKYDSAANVNDDFPKTLGKSLALAVRPVPTLVDGGNLLVSGDFCFTSVADLPRVAKDGAVPVELEPGPLALADKSRGFFRMFGCRDALVIRNAPHAHIDMWLKPIKDGVVAVNELSKETLKTVAGPDGFLPPDLLELKERLDLAAAELAKVVKVERLPMPLPYRGAYRTFANAVLVNGTAIVPRFEHFGWNYDQYPDQKLEPTYEAKTKRIYEKYGYRVKFIPADELIYNGGGFHCVTLQFPAMAGQPKGS